MESPEIRYDDEGVARVWCGEGCGELARYDPDKFEPFTVECEHGKVRITEP